MIDSEIRLEKSAQLMETLIVGGLYPGEDWILELSNHLRVVMK